MIAPVSRRIGRPRSAEKAAATAKAKRAEFDALCESFPDHQSFWQHHR